MAMHSDQIALLMPGLRAGPGCPFGPHADNSGLKQEGEDWIAIAVFLGTLGFYAAIAFRLR